MSERPTICLVGATGLIGGEVIRLCADRRDVQLVPIARRGLATAERQHIHPVVADPARWDKAMGAARPAVLICALGTTWAKAGRSEAAFRAVDHDLVFASAQAALRQGAERMVLVSSIGADPRSRSFYLRVKGKAERAVAALGFARLDILRPGLLLGTRSSDRRLGERAAQIAAPVTNLLLRGIFRQYRAIPAATVARAALALAMDPAAGRVFHDNDAIVRAALSLPAQTGG